MDLMNKNGKLSKKQVDVLSIDMTEMYIKDTNKPAMFRDLEESSPRPWKGSCIHKEIGSFWDLSEEKHTEQSASWM